MKKTKFIAGITALSIMMMGAGYAMWSQSFAATNDVNTGELAVDASVNSYQGPTNNYTTINTVEEADENIRTTITNAYPGAEYTYKVDVKNTGSMGVKLEQVTPTVEGLSDEQNTKYIHVTNDSDGSVIDPGETKTITYTVDFDGSAPNDITENKPVTLTNDIKYVQFNQQQAPAAPANPQ